MKRWFLVLAGCLGALAATLASCAGQQVEVAGGDGGAPDMGRGPEAASGCSSNQECEGGICNLEAGTCAPGCTRDSDCHAPGAPRCNVANNTCVPCLPLNDNCPPGSMCKQQGNGSYACAAGCNATSECALADAGSMVRACCNHLCVDTSSDVGNCSVCGKVCMGLDAGACCSSTCTDLSSNPVHCGGCGKACSSNNVASVTCGGGVCDGMCDPGFGDCNNNKLTDGCETSLLSDPQHCGGCTSVCSSNHMASVTCGNGICDGPCSVGWSDCNNDKLTDGCEANTGTDAMNCGGCGLACSNNHMATLTCAAGTCNGVCAAGYADCNNNKLTDGCESQTATDPANCGGCGMPCSTNNMATVTCTAGACTGTCAAGFFDCNNNLRTDGCEVNTASDPNNCSMCGHVCPPATPSCGNGVCTTLYTFTGVQTNVPLTSLAGWTQCLSDDYGTTLPLTSTILAGCPGSHLLLGCMSTGATALTIAAMGLTSDVTFVTGNNAMGQNHVHTANGVEWYFDNNWAWGYAPAGDAVNLYECDTAGVPDNGLRLCWHTLPNVGGYRCGAASGLNGPAVTGWTRVVYSAP
jgi:hypothetical protein